MTPARAVRALEKLAPLALGCVLAAVVLAVPWPPCTDLAHHEGMVALLVRRGDPGFAPPGLYELSLGHANQLAYALAWPLARVVGAGPACRLVLAASLVAALGLAGRLATHAGKTPAAALAVAPAALGWAFYWGFLPQMLGFALWLGALPLLDDAARRATALRTAAACAAMVVLGAAHAASLACACVATAVFALVRPPDRRTPLRLLPAALGAALQFVEARREDAIATPLSRIYASRVLWHPLGAKLRALGANLLGVRSTWATVTLAVLALVLVLAWRRAAAHAGRGSWLPAWPERHRFALLACALLAAYLASPYSVNFGAMLYVRFLAPAWAVAVIALAPPGERRGPPEDGSPDVGPRVLHGSLVVAPAAALALVPLVLVVPQLEAAARSWGALEPLLARVDRGSAVAVVHFGRHDRALAFDPASLGNRVLAERGGRLLQSFAEYPVSPVVVRPDLRWDATVLRVTAGPGALRPAHDLLRLRWVLVHMIDEALARRVVRAFAPEGELVAAEGDWMLFRSTLPPVPVESPDADPPPDSQTLQERVNLL